MREVRVSHPAPPPGSSLPSQTELRSGRTLASPLHSYPPTSRCHSSPGSRSRLDFVPNVKAPRLHFRFRGAAVSPPEVPPPRSGTGPLLLPRLHPHAPRNPDAAHAPLPLLSRTAPWAAPQILTLLRPFFFFFSPPPKCPGRFTVPPAEKRLKRLSQTIFSNNPSMAYDMLVTSDLESVATSCRPLTPLISVFGVVLTLDLCQTSCVRVLALQFSPLGNLISPSVSFFCKMERILNALLIACCPSIVT